MQRKIFSDLDSSVGSRLSRHNELYHSCEEFVIMMNGSRGKLPHNLLPLLYHMEPGIPRIPWIMPGKLQDFLRSIGVIAY